MTSSPSILNVPKSYDATYIETHRIYPLFDKKIESVLYEFHTNGIAKPIPLIDQSIIDNEYSDAIISNFTTKFTNHITSSKRNNIKGLDSFTRSDPILGCTQFIDDLYVMYGQSNIQVLEKEYTYHYRLFPNTIPSKIGSLDPNKQLILSCPFVNGSMHTEMEVILQECNDKKINVHLDMAWLSAAKNVNVDLSNPCIRSVGFSLSKGYGLSGWNRVGLRFVKENRADSISLMTDYSQIHSLPLLTGSYFLDRLDPDHLWDAHEHNYYKICNDFNLVPTNTIHVTLSDGYLRGIGPLLRYMEDNV